MKDQLTICTADQLHVLVERIKPLMSAQRNVVLLYGDLGSGKTALVKAFVDHEMGMDADSPTFSIVNTYENGESTVHHFDLYRLQDAQEIEDIGFWDYVDSQAPCFVEWPEKIAELLPDHQCLHIKISLNLNQCRDYLLSYS